MEKQNAVDSLKESIRILEIRQAQERIILKEQFIITYESLKPINLIKNSAKELAHSAEIKNSLFETVVYILSGYLTKKLIINSKSGTFMKLFGALLQFGITRALANNAETIQIFISNLIEKFHTSAKKEVIDSPSERATGNITR
jgi:hypothetical protein